MTAITTVAGSACKCRSRMADHDAIELEFFRHIGAQLIRLGTGDLRPDAHPVKGAVSGFYRLGKTDETRRFQPLDHVIGVSLVAERAHLHRKTEDRKSTRLNSSH